MQYRSPTDFSHAATPRTGVLLANLGTPEAPDRRSVRRYLKEFLWDPRVVEASRPLWWLVLNGIILNTRPARSARAYASVWGENGSPLLDMSLRQHRALSEALGQRHGADVVVALGMRYGKPSIREALESLDAAGCRRLLVLPLYPQYSATTTASIFDAVTTELHRWRWIPELRFVNQYHDHDGYIDALADSVRRHQQQHGRPRLLLMSFHGIPREYFDHGDPYYCHCQKTARLLAERLGLAADDYRVTFQSRLGPKQWLQPYTDATLRELPASGIRDVQVICPGFSADCLETLEEIAVENRDTFVEAGGERYGYIPALNDDTAHIDMLAGLVDRHLAGWAGQGEDPRQTVARAGALGADF